MKKHIKPALLAVVSCIAGIINALLGAGGGVLLSLTLPHLAVDAIGGDTLRDRRDIYINAQAAMIPACAISCLIYSMRGMLDVVGFSLFAIPAAAGGAVGSFLLSKIKSNVIQIIFAILVIWSGVRMITG